MPASNPPKRKGNRTEAGRLKAAIGQWKKLSVERRMQAVEELVEVRLDELVRSYAPDVVAVTAGFRTTRNKKGEAGGRVMSKEPCVGFVVKKKWKEPRSAKKAADRNKQKQARELPVYLFTHVDGELCAVPTDVESSSEINAVLQNSRIKADRGIPPRLFGTICAIVRRPSQIRLYALGCHHVFAFSKKLRSVPDRVLITHKERPIGVLSKRRGSSRRRGRLGTLHPIRQGVDVEYSLDAALTEVVDRDELRKAVPHPAEGGVARSIAEIPKRFGYLIAVSSRDETVKVQFVKTVFSHDLKYGVGRCRHRRLIRSRFVSRRTQGGDSGAPVVSLDSSRLLGMHIAISEDGLDSYMIPAYDLLNEEEFGFPGTRQLVVVPASALG